MTRSLCKLAEDLHRVEEALAEFRRGIDRVEYNLILIEATNQVIRDGHSLIGNGHLQ